MLTVIRKNQQFLMLLIASLTIIAFVLLYTRTNLTQLGTNDVVSVYGRVIQKAEIDHQARGYSLALALGLTDFVSDLGGMGASEEASLSNFILNLFVIEHQAPELGIRPSDEAVAEVIKSLPVLQTKGVFDPAKYALFLQEQLAPKGFTELQMEEIVRDSLRVRELRRVVTSPVAIGEGQVRASARVFQSIAGQIVRFDRAPFLKSASVTPDEIAIFYTKNKAGLQSRETRSLSYVMLDLSPAQQNLGDRERTSLLQKLADDAEAARKSISGEVAKGVDFMKAAEKASLHPKNTAALERDGRQEGKDSGMPEALLASAFWMQKSGEIDTIQDGNAFYIFTVKGITPSRQLELAEVSEKIGSLLKEQKAEHAATEAATKSLAQIRSSMASGKSFAEAVKSAGAKAEQFASLVPSDSKNTPEQKAIVTSALSLKEGDLGPLQPAPWGTFVVYLQKRTPLTDAQWKEHQATISQRLLENEKELLFMEWLRSARSAAQIKMLRPTRGRGGA